jgi:AcrR family transcriptional regulator
MPCQDVYMTPPGSRQAVKANGRTYAGVPAAERSAARTRQLLDAGLELFGTQGVARVTVEDICREAGLTKRYFYERFSSFDEFVDAVMGDVLSNLSDRILGIGGPGGTLESGQAQLAGFVEAITEDPRLARLLLAETFGAEGSLGRLRQQLVHRAVEVMVVDMASSKRAQAATDPGRVRMLAFALSGAFAELLLAWLDGDVDASVDEVTTFLGALFSRASVLTRPRSR